MENDVVAAEDDGQVADSLVVWSSAADVDLGCRPDEEAELL